MRKIFFLNRKGRARTACLCSRSGIFHEDLNFVYTVVYVLIGAMRELEFHCGSKLCDLKI